MSTVTILSPDKKREYDISYDLTSYRLFGKPKFRIRAITVEDGKFVTGTEFATVAAYARDCYHEEMLFEATRRRV